MKKVSIVLLLYIIITPVFSQSQRRRGFPEKAPAHLFEKFQNPPKGYGNVPFYWWQGDKLVKERLKEQLDILSEAPMDGFAVSYAHTHPKVDVEMAVNGYGFAGNTEPGDPELFSEAWWEIWKWYSEECAKYGIGVGMDDYTFGWPDNGYFPDQIRDLPEFSNYRGNLAIETVEVKGNSRFERAIPEHFLTAVAWPGPVLLDSYITSGTLQWTAPEGDGYKVYLVTTEKGFAIHPDHGSKLVEMYFDEFERRLTPEEAEGMNYFFQDELTYPLTMLSWSEDFREVFRGKKGYDILPFLPALTDNIGPQTPTIRLDYCEVLVDLAEERYFEPIYRWHADKELIYGSDNHGRGKDPLAYVDYFRANSWYTAPGNDAPSRGSSFLETKVSSSIAHLYQRPRTWLEAFHSMGWSSTGAWLTEQIDHHFIAGGNLVCMHGLYYSTHGGWWEWAPPCFHFRMPYWPHMIQWLKYAERMSYMLSQGVHVCDIALMYPTESMQAYPEAEKSITFDLAMALSEHGLDYDFMHYKPLREATTANGHLTVGDECYKILILSDLWACHASTLQKALDHYRNGGIVIGTGRLPEADGILELFSGRENNHPSGGKALYLQPDELIGEIKKMIVPDFSPVRGTGKVLHRRIGEQDLYMVANVEKGDTCFFRAKGKVELWDAFTGEKQSYPVLKTDENGTYLRMDKKSNQSYLLLFSPGEPEISKGEKEYHLIQQTPLSGPWQIEYHPTMDNKWGDYRLPASDGMIGPEAPVFKYRKAGTAKDGWYTENYDDTNWRESIYGYGIQTEYCLIDSLQDFHNSVSRIQTEKDVDWQPYEFSWQYGVWFNPGPQGYHGLKNRVSNEFFILNNGGHEFYRTYVWVPESGRYKAIIEGREPDILYINGKNASEVLSSSMKKGWYEVLAGYNSTPQINYRRGAYNTDPRQRSMVVFCPENETVPAKTGMYDPVVSSSWGLMEHLYYSPYPDTKNSWQFRFRTVPGVKEITIKTYGEIKNVWIEGKKLPARQLHLKQSNEEINQYSILFPVAHETIETIALEVNALPGYQGAAIMAEPVTFNCETGLLPAGNWAEQGSLRYYSGGMYYRKKIDISTEKEDKVMIDLGEVIATCEVKVNGQSAGILLGPPYTLDITNHLQPGENDLEVLVYSTLSNHYQTIPSTYSGPPDAGLIGPVTINVWR